MGELMAAMGGAETNMPALCTLGATSSLRVPYVCVYASQVAMCIGRNCHKSEAEAMRIMWQRIDPQGFREAMRRNRIISDDDVLQTLVASKEEVRALVGKSMVAPLSSTEVAKCFSGAVTELQHVELSAHEKQLLEKEVKKNLYTTYGTRAETEMLGYIRDTLHIPCHPVPTFFKQHMGEVVRSNGTRVPWFVGGKIDALSDDGALLIEIKNRVNRLFGKTPEYEKVQVQTYLELLDMNHGALIECFKGAEGNVQANLLPIARDKRFWKEDVVPKLETFVEFLVRLIHDTDTQDTFLASKRPSTLIRKKL